MTTVPGLGVRGQVKNVKPGYYRNYLFPQKKALLASPCNLERYEYLLQNVDYDALEREKQLHANRRKLNEIVVSMKRQVISENPVRLHSSVTQENIAEKIQKFFGLTVDPQNIHLPSPLTKLGVHRVSVSISDTETVMITVSLNRR
eukprot:CAMPEP_0201487976 /NCGR_PEP_ID=MMETSP0151_2-20130828/16470_1 /ASSEMBLY_ACC=CAM_ASM_000257 /TAXON_ID=200890 /ORGANISM="Paramoeba atlantica, Strain 621/1 / CCAP 1560/9" /LENGTH=145 /DNA_ID=CAMNT_0047873171 /DNA_START=233 /DNA_END=666 /DNA_ORIENTATION=+